MDKQEFIQLDEKVLALRGTNRYRLRLNERINPSVEFPSYAHEFSFENGMMLIHVNEDGAWIPNYRWNAEMDTDTVANETFQPRNRAVYYFLIANIPNFVKTVNEEYLDYIVRPYEGETKDD